jgi:hypothetical protein
LYPPGTTSVSGGDGQGAEMSTREKGDFSQRRQYPKTGRNRVKNIVGVTAHSLGLRTCRREEGKRRENAKAQRRRWEMGTVGACGAMGILPARRGTEPGGNGRNKLSLANPGNLLEHDNPSSEGAQQHAATESQPGLSVTKA